MSRIHKVICDGCGSEEELDMKYSQKLGGLGKGKTDGILDTPDKKSGLCFYLPDGWKKIAGRDVCPSCKERVESIISGDQNG